ncbi:aminoglycoside phosphotransferase family protein [Spirosoma harenae]
MLEQLKTVIITRFPELINASFSLLTAGWDSVAVDVDDRLIFKFPRDEEGIEALRKEANMLAIVRSKVTLPVPNLEFFDAPRPFSRHTKLKGEHLITAQYELLNDSAKHRLANDIARFYAELHAIDLASMQAVGASVSEPGLTNEQIWAGIHPILPISRQAKAQKTLEAWAQLPPDPYGITYGFFDGHGWNMAFDHEAQKLAGIYDFGDSGLDELHQEFIYTNFISTELTSRVINNYEKITGRVIDRERVSILTGVLFLGELAEMSDDPDYADAVLANALNWLSAEE